MRKEVTTTTIKIAEMKMVDGEPKAVSLPDEILLGNISLEKAQREITKKFGRQVTVLQVIPETSIYEMEVKDFMEVATKIIKK